MQSTHNNIQVPQNGEDCSLDGDSALLSSNINVGEVAKNEIADFAPSSQTHMNALDSSSLFEGQQLVESKLSQTKFDFSIDAEKAFFIKKELDITDPTAEFLRYDSTNKVLANSSSHISPVKVEAVSNNRLKEQKLPIKLEAASKKASEDLMASWATKNNKTLRKKAAVIKISTRKSLSKAPKSQLMLKLERLKLVTTQTNPPRKNRKSFIKQEFSAEIESDLKPGSKGLVENLSPDTKPYVSPYIDSTKTELITSQDYQALEQEAFYLWKSQRKDLDSPYKKRNDLLYAFLNGSTRDKLKIIILSYLDMIEELPVIFAIYQQKKLAMKSGLKSTSEIDNALAVWFKWVKVKCALFACEGSELAKVLEAVDKSLLHQFSFSKNISRNVVSPLNFNANDLSSQISECIDTIFDNCTIFSTDISKTAQVLTICKKSQNSLIASLNSSETELILYLQQLLVLFTTLPLDYSDSIEKNILQAYLKLDLLHRHKFCSSISLNYSYFGLYIYLVCNSLSNQFLISHETHLKKLNSNSLNYHSNILSALFISKNFPWLDLTTDRFLNFKNLSKIQQYFQEHINNLVKGPVTSASTSEWYNFAVSWCGILGFAHLESNEEGFSLCVKLARISRNEDEYKICCVLGVLLASSTPSKSAKFAKEMLLGLLNTNTSIYFSLFIILLFLQKIDEAENLLYELSGISFPLIKKKLYFLRDLIDFRNDLSANLYKKSILNITNQSKKILPQDSRLIYKTILHIFKDSSLKVLPIDINSWLLSVIKSANLIDISFVFELIQQSIDFGYGPIPEAEILPILSGNFMEKSKNGGSLNTTISHEYMLILFYVLYFNKKIFEAISNKTMPKPGSLNSDYGELQDVSPIYSDDLINSVPAKIVLEQLEKYRVAKNKSVVYAYQNILPDYLSLLITQYEYQIQPNGLLYRKTDESGLFTGILSSYKITNDKKSFERLTNSINTVFSNLNLKDPESVNSAVQLIRSYTELNCDFQYKTTRIFIESALHNILLQLSDYYSNNLISSQLTPDEKSHAVSINGNEPSFIKNKNIQKSSNVQNVSSMILNLLNAFFSAWEILFDLNPASTAISVINAISFIDKYPHYAKHSIQELWANPLIMFNCNSFTFKYPQIATIFLATLKFFLLMSRNKYLNNYAKNSSLDRFLTFKKENLNTLLYLQESSAIQILIEIVSLSDKNSFLNNNDPSRDLIKKKIYEFIHQQYIDQKIMLKLICFQTYDHSLISEMVINVPSIHACTDFLPELIIQPCLKQMIFGVELAGHLFQFYPLLKNESMAKEVILPHIISSLKSFVAGVYEKQDIFTINILLSSLIRIAFVFPVILSSTVLMLEEFQKESIKLLYSYRNFKIESLETNKQNSNISKMDDISAFRCQIFSDRIENVVSIINPVKYNYMTPNITSVSDESNNRASSSDLSKKLDFGWEKKNNIHSFNFISKYTEESCYIEFLNGFKDTMFPANCEVLPSISKSSQEQNDLNLQLQPHRSNTTAMLTMNSDNKNQINTSENQVGDPFISTDGKDYYSEKHSNYLQKNKMNQESTNTTGPIYSNKNRPNFYQKPQYKNYQSNSKNAIVDSTYSTNTKDHDKLNNDILNSNGISIKNSYNRSRDRNGDSEATHSAQIYENNTYSNTQNNNDNRKRNINHIQDINTKNYHSFAPNSSNDEKDLYQYDFDNFNGDESSKPISYKGGYKRKANNEMGKDSGKEHFKRKNNPYNQNKNQAGQKNFGNQRDFNANYNVGPHGSDSGYRPRTFKERNAYKQSDTNINNKKKFKFNKNH
ncbi:hypothetical protein BB561_004960 [Smittium simulii]|uniref:Uncharacterized protein n=1 Tax=Smittium simulii TaxID=133385 RepID=A0A2T9YD48_9FUNG|nr:hypothetical protein BB561_004960 [Smittium simulii]